MGVVTRILLGLVCLLSWIGVAFSQPYQVKAFDVVYYLYKGEKLEWYFKAKEFIEVSPNYFMAKLVHIVNDPKHIIIKGKEATYDRLKDEFIIVGNATFIAPKVGTILTQELIFYPSKSLVTTDKEVEVRKKGMLIKGKGMTYYINTGEFRLKQRANIKFEL